MTKASGFSADPIIANELAVFACEGALSVAGYLRGATRTIPAFDIKQDTHDPVTAHDRAVEHALQQFLGAAVPGSRILGEEMGEQVLPGEHTERLSNGARSLGSRVRWIVDPIDGTANFAAGLTYFGTSVGVELDGEIVAGAISIPNSYEVFVADTQDAWHLDREGNRTLLHANGPTREEQALLASYFPSSRLLKSSPKTALAHEVELRDAHMVMRRPGAVALDLAHVAAGWIGVCVGGSFKPWDVAAGLHLVKVAGGQVVNLPLGTELPSGLRPGVVATGANLSAVTAEKVLREIDQLYQK